MSKPAKTEDGPEIYVTPNGRQYIKAAELIESPKFESIVNSMKNIPIFNQSNDPQKSANGKLNNDSSEES